MNPQWIYVYMDFVLLPNPIKLRQIEFFTIGLYSEGYDDWIIFVVVQHFRCRKICQIVCRVHRKWMESKFLHQDVDDEVFLANKGTVIVCFVDRNDKKILIETGKLIDNVSFESIKIFRDKIVWNCNLWVYYTIPFGFSLFWHVRDISFQLLKLLLWLRTTDEGSVPEMRIWSILWIKSGLK